MIFLKTVSVAVASDSAEDEGEVGTPAVDGFDHAVDDHINDVDGVG